MEIQLFYHAAIMGSWRHVLWEQRMLFERVGLRPKIGAVGPSARGRLPRMGEVVYRSAHVEEFETPTLQKMWEWCRSLENPSNYAVIYCHTKGVSKGGGRDRTEWRHLMQKWVIERWRENLPLMDTHDVLGVGYMSEPNHHVFTKHFAGNFWIARCDWIIKLDPPMEYAARFPRAWRRYAPEMWVLHKEGFRPYCLTAENAALGRRWIARRELSKPCP